MFKVKNRKEWHYTNSITDVIDFTRNSVLLKSKKRFKIGINEELLIGKSYNFVEIFNQILVKKTRIKFEYSERLDSDFLYLKIHRKDLFNDYNLTLLNLMLLNINSLPTSNTRDYQVLKNFLFIIKSSEKFLKLSPEFQSKIISL